MVPSAVGLYDALRARFKGEGPGRSPQGHQKTEILRHLLLSNRKALVCIFRYYKKYKKFWEELMDYFP
jgi:hypothetical protein